VAIFDDVLNSIGFGYGNYSLFRDAPVKRHLGFCPATLRRYLAQGFTTIFLPNVLKATFKWTVRHYGNVYFPEVIQDTKFYPPFHQTKVYLI